PGPSEGGPGAAPRCSRDPTGAERRRPRRCPRLAQRDRPERHLGAAYGDRDLAVEGPTSCGVVVPDVERDRLALLRGELEVDSALDRARDAHPIEGGRNARAIDRRAVRVEDIPIRVD